MISLYNVNKTYSGPKKDVNVLKNINISINNEEFVSIYGNSGAGKTTLISILSLLKLPTSGKYLIDKNDTSLLGEEERLSIRNEKVGTILPSSFLLPFLNITDNITLPLEYRGISEEKKMIRAREIANKLGISDLMEMFPDKLSSLESRRVSLARAMINSPKLLLADEPTKDLNTLESEEFLSHLQFLNREGICIIMSTQNLEIAKHAKRVLMLKDGVITKDIPVPNPLQAKQMSDKLKQ